MKVETIDLPTGSYEIAVAGPGGRPLLLIHGFTGAKEDFADFIDPFADRGFHVVAPDLRGHGGSVQPADEAAYSLALMAQDVLALADGLGWDGFSVVGHSMGGMVAQHVVLAAPRRVGALILMDTDHGTVSGIDPDLAALAIEVARSEGLAALAELQRQYDPPLATGPDARVRAERPGYVEFGERKFLSCSPAMYAAMAGELLGPADRLPALRGIATPTLVLVGEEDASFRDAAARMAAAIPGAELVVVPDAGHSPQFEAADVWWDAVSGFLERVRPT